MTRRTLTPRGLLLAGAAALALAVAAARAPGQVPGNAQRYPTAHCQDGTYYYGPKSRRLACKGHRGVAEWLAPPQGAGRPPAAQPAATAPKGATARCRDGTWSRVRDRARACAGHRGVAKWLRAK